MSAFETVMDALRDRGERIIARGGTARTRGLCHNGDAPDTVALAIGHDKRVLVHCFKGCNPEEYVAPLGLAMTDLYEAKAKDVIGRVATSYTYIDAEGTVVQYVDRYFPKKFRPRLPNGTRKHPERANRVLYRLPQVAVAAKDGSIVYVVEGEKDADRLTAAGAIATTMPGGTGMGWEEHYSQALVGAQVIVIADRDPKGEGLTHADKVIASLTRHHIPCQLLLPAVGKDVADHLSAGLGPGDLITLDQLNEAPAAEQQADDPGAEEHPEDQDVVEQKIAALIGELLDTDDLDNIPNLQPLIADMLFLDSLARVNGPSGHGKSFVTLDFAGCVGTGSDWHGHATSQGLVIYLVAEGARGIRKRVRAWEKQNGMRMTGVKFLPRPVQAMDVEWLVLIEVCRRLRPALIIVDTQARVTVGVEENSATEMGRVVHRMEELRGASGACLLLVHHKGLSGDHGRGSTAVKGAMQTELTVTKEGSRVIVATDKQKDTEELGKIGFTLTSVQLDGEAEEDGRPVTSAVLVPIDTPMPVSPGQIAAWLDAQDVPSDWGRERVTKVLGEAGVKVRKDKIEQAIRIRKLQSEDLPPPRGRFPKDSAPKSGAGFEETPDETCPQGPGQDLPPSSLHHLPPPTTFRWGQVGGTGAVSGAPEHPECTVCGHRLDADWAARGHDTHLAC
ncbi:AAA family ATPase [Streptacidiphilus sp. PAMC 29251]